MKKIILATVIISLSAFIFTQCDKSSNISKKSIGNEKTLIVASTTVNCTGAMPMKCLQVKEKVSDEWNYFYNNIQGFTYEPGYEYVLKVKTEKIVNPPIDGSSVKYTLVRQVSKIKK